MNLFQTDIGLSITLQLVLVNQPANNRIRQRQPLRNASSGKRPIHLQCLCLQEGVFGDFGFGKSVFECLCLWRGVFSFEFLSPMSFSILPRLCEGFHLSCLCNIYVSRLGRPIKLTPWISPRSHGIGALEEAETKSKNYSFAYYYTYTGTRQIGTKEEKESEWPQDVDLILPQSVSQAAVILR